MSHRHLIIHHVLDALFNMFHLHSWITMFFFLKKPQIHYRLIDTPYRPLCRLFCMLL